MQPLTWVARRLTVVQQLTHDRATELANQHYSVSPKADGLRVLILCDWETTCLFKIPVAPTPDEATPLRDSCRIGGFLLDAEEVKLSSGRVAYLAFDVVAIAPITLMHFGFTVPSQWGFFGWQMLQNEHLPKPLLERQQLLEKIVAACNAPNLKVKPIWGADQK